jgi:hypothetical protein
VKLTTLLHLAPRSTRWTYTSTPPYAFIVIMLNEESVQRDPLSRYSPGGTEEYHEQLRRVNTEAEIPTDVSRKQDRSVTV